MFRDKFEGQEPTFSIGLAWSSAGNEGEEESHFLSDVLGRRSQESVEGEAGNGAATRLSQAPALVFSKDLFCSLSLKKKIFFESCHPFIGISLFLQDHLWDATCIISNFFFIIQIFECIHVFVFFMRLCLRQNTECFCLCFLHRVFRGTRVRLFSF